MEFGKCSPLLVECDGGKRLTLKDFEETEENINLLKRFHKVIDNRQLTEETISKEERCVLNYLDKKYDIPAVSLLNPSYEGLKRLVQENCHVPSFLLHIPHIHTAVRKDDLHIVKYIAKHSSILLNTLFHDVCNIAIKHDRLEILKWLRNNGCPWHDSTCEDAISNGHLKTLKWLHENGCPWGNSACLYAINNGRVEILKYLYKNGRYYDGYFSNEDLYRGC
jgi:hypothetical protein